MDRMELPDADLKQQIRQLYGRLLLRDRARIAFRLKNMDFADRPGLEELCRRLENLSAHALTRFAAGLKTETDPALPISAKASETYPLRIPQSSVIHK